ncbi:hypothetical protein B0T11DRAFT_285592 [Plectosphaerella cucumerina]|uniref:Mgs207 protein n=1 Tax=Plectosphaerella cucumerina TaxID=40658 RepID=A0A8K0TIH7_9PEZI|nr:hypothetical protein B0T11DRAFT_285592 [Plectosphaerella cucumerina]
MDERTNRWPKMVSSAWGCVTLGSHVPRLLRKLKDRVKIRRHRSEFRQDHHLYQISAEFNMASLLSYIPIVNRLVGDDVQSIDLPPVDVHDVETAQGRRARCLKHLIKGNHANHSVVYHNLQFDNHTPHILSSAYLLGATEKQLHDIYEVEAKELEPWQDAPAEVTEDDWRDFLGEKEYQRGFLDFFEDNLALEFSYDWRKVTNHFLFTGKEPLINGVFGGLGHPLIHLGYAYEMNSKDIAMEALTLTAVQYNYLHKYLDDKNFTKPSAWRSTSPLEILDKVANDKRFDRLFEEPGFSNVDKLFEKHEDLVMEYWNAWDVKDPIKQFEKSQEAAVALLVATVKPGTHAYSFFIVHLLTTSHAIRILLPFIPAKFHVPLVRGWWLLALAVYIAHLRPQVDPDNVDSDLKGRSWTWVESQAINSVHATDAHYVKAIRAIKEAARTWGDVHDRYLAAAVTFADNFHGWVFN